MVAININIIIISPCGRDSLKIMTLLLEPLFREDGLSPSVTTLSLQSQVPVRGSSEVAAEGFLEDEDWPSAFTKFQGAVPAG